MSTRIKCRDAQQHLPTIKALERQLDQCLFEVTQTTDPRTIGEYQTEARKIKQELEEKMAALMEQINPFERLFHLKEQYQSQVRVLEVAQILTEEEVNGEIVKGFFDIEGNFQPLPSLQEVIEILLPQKELLELKADQGFGQVRLVPFGMSLWELFHKYKEVLEYYAQQEILFTTQKDDSDLYEPRSIVPIYAVDSLYIAPEYYNADIDGKLVYGVTQFDPDNHNGQTKAEILRERKLTQKSGGGWNIIVLENEVNIPRLGLGKTIGGRKQIETGRKIERYLKLIQLQIAEYEGEVGIRPEENIIHSLTAIIEKNELIDDRGENGAYSSHIGAYFPMKGRIKQWAENGMVPYIGFNSHDYTGQLIHCHVHSSGNNIGIRTVIRV